MEDGGAGLRVDPTDAQSIVDAVEGIKADPDAAGSPEARQSLRLAHSWDREERAFVEQVESALGRRESTRRGT